MYIFHFFFTHSDIYTIILLLLFKQIFTHSFAYRFGSRFYIREIKKFLT